MTELPWFGLAAVVLQLGVSAPAPAERSGVGSATTAGPTEPATAAATGKRLGPLFFNPEGADFTAWLDNFKKELQANWSVPRSTPLAFRGHVDTEFTIERDGRMSSIRVVKSCGVPSLDRAAENTLRASRQLPLPSDFAPPKVTMQVSFAYNEKAQAAN
jgi:TonB family protein